MPTSAPSPELVKLLNRRFLDAAQKGNLKEIESLLGQGVEVDTRDDTIVMGGNYGPTALHYAAQFGHVEIVKFLLEKGANLDLQDHRSNKPRDLAVKNDHFAVSHLLAQAGFKEHQAIVKKEILTGNPYIFYFLKTPHLDTLKSITADDLGNASEENVIKLKESGAYALLKIMKDLDDEEIIIATKYLDVFKAISDKAEAFRKPELSDDLTSKILMYTLDPKEPPYGLGEKLTLKIIGILTAPVARSNPSLVPPNNSDSTSAQPVDPQQSSAQAPTTRPSPPFGESPIINPVVTAQLVFAHAVVANTPTNGPYAKPSNPYQLSAQASTNPNSTSNFQSLINPKVTAQLVLAPVAVAQENPSSITVVRPGFVKSQIAAIEERLKNGSSR